MYVFSVHVRARYEMHWKMNRFIYVYNLILILLRFIDINLILIFSHDHNIYTVWNCSYTWFTCKFYLPVSFMQCLYFFPPGKSKGQEQNICWEQCLWYHWWWWPLELATMVTTNDRFYLQEIWKINFITASSQRRVQLMQEPIQKCS